MTGFGASQVPLAHGSLVLELRSVNHRHLEVRTRAHGPLADAQAQVEDFLRRRATRGRFDVLLRLEGGGSPPFDAAMLQAAARELAAVRDLVAPSEPLPWALLAGRTDLFVSESRLDDEELRAAVDAACGRAFEVLDGLRRREGAELALELGRILDELEAEVAAIAEAGPGIVERQRERLRARVDELLARDATRLPADRLAHEVALLADRMDVTEEIARLRSHLGLFRSLLGSDEAVGRKLDFVVQEMLREINTTGSKIPDANVAHRVVAMKTLVERLREQSANVL